ncbi:MAG TPA: Crp/Fnr family transcriptional regulator [Longimicrobiales bacterium]|nr:Crp/Fnr family transcriptional regulator [Longimicrobiales bacterium]
MPLRLVPQRDRKLNRILADGESVALSRGEVLFEVADAADRLWVVREGHLRLVLPCRRGGEGRTVALAGPGELFGVEALVDGSSRSYQAVAGEAARVTGADGATTLRGLRGTVHTLPLLLNALREDLLRSRWSPPGAGGPSTAERLADLLLELASRFGQWNGKEVRVPHWFTHGVLGDLAGAHRSTVTTVLNDWIYEGVLEEGSEALVIARASELEARSSGREGWMARR